MEKESLLEKDIVETATTESTRKDTSMAAWMDKKYCTQRTLEQALRSTANRNRGQQPLEDGLRDRKRETERYTAPPGTRLRPYIMHQFICIVYCGTISSR